MRPGTPRRSDDAGSAVVEFVVLGMLLLLPVVYLVLTVGRVQAAIFAADGSAREAARAYVTSADPGLARARAESAVRLAAVDQGFDAADARLLLDCSDDPCLSPGAFVTARVEVDVVLPGVPALVDRFVPTHVTVRAAQVAGVDAFRTVAAP